MNTVSKHLRHTVAMAVLMCMALMACSTVPRINAGGYTNREAKRDYQINDRAAFPNCSDDIIYAQANRLPICDSALFIGVAISGGGSRAANLGLGSLWALQQLGIFSHVTALSSVSGGSLAATYVALNGLDSPAKFEDAATAMRLDFLGNWMLRSASPIRVLRVNTTHDTATQTLADTFDALLFHGETFASLGPFRSGRPYLYLNASLQNVVTSRGDMTTRGENASSGSLQGFTFSRSAFDAIHSDLGSYRLADAVGASGAYPGLFEPMTLRNYSILALPGDPPDAYLHLSDGGLADNLGVDALIRALEETRNVVLNSRREPQACLLILIDAAVHTPLEDSGSRRDLRGSPLNSVVSSSLRRGYDILLDRRREDQLGYLGLNVSSNSPMRFNPAATIPFGNYSYIDYGTLKTRSQGPHMRQQVVGDGLAVTEASCAVWHVSFDHLMEIAGMHNRYLRENYGPWTSLPDPLKNDVEGSTKKLNYFISSISTNYRLVLDQARGCPSKHIQSAIFDAASALIRSDDETLDALVDWLKEHREPALAASVERGRLPLTQAASMQGVHIDQGKGGVLNGGVTCEK